MVKINKGLIIAAGIGSRIRPLSNKIPKPLIKVKGTPMIETVIDAMIENGVKEIYIVLGYLKEKFYYLKDKYDEVKFIINEDYASRGAISSFYAAKDILDDNFIISEGNFYVTDKTIFDTNIDKTTYLYKQTESQNELWGFKLIHNKTRITRIVKPEEQTYLDNRLYGVAFWLKDDLLKLKNEVIKNYEKKEYIDAYHDRLLNNIIDDMELVTREVKDQQIYEINKLNDLVLIDKRYIEILKRQEETKFKKVIELAEILSLNSDELVGVYESPGRSTNNKNYVIETEDETYFLRIAGEGSELFSDRKNEKDAYEQFEGKDIVDQVYFLDEDTGMKISKFYENSRVLNINDKDQLNKFIKKLKLIHNGDFKFTKTDTIFDRMIRYEEYVMTEGGEKHFQEGISEIIKEMYKYKEVLKDDMIIIPIHGDCSPNNTLVLENGDIKLIDLEFISMGDPYTDLANFAHDGEMNPKQLLNLLKMYLDRKPTKKELYKLYIFAATISIMWYSWAVYKMTVEPENLYKFKDYRDSYYDWYKLMYKEALKYE